MISRGTHRVAIAALGALAGVAVIAASGGVAQAQSLRPNILVIFDTSGSMLNNNTNDGSPLCAGAGNTSRIYNLKRALRESLAQVGTDEANFGLMRFPQIERPTMDLGCPRGHYFNNNTTGTGCHMTTHAAETTYGAWFDNGLRESLVVDVTKRPVGQKPVAADFDPIDANISEVYRWIDLSEDTDNAAPISDPELRSGNGWLTPLARTLLYARLYLDNYVKPTDPKAACRTNVVILVTDGAETCDDATPGPMPLDLTTCMGAGYDTLNAEVQACLLFQNTKAKTYVLTDTGAGAANDRIAVAGRTTSIRVTLTDVDAVKAALLGIIAETVPPPEMCNGKDDNCNGLIDEGVSNMCPLSNNPNDPDNLLGTGAKHCALETCNCLDDDCDGLIDEGFAPNACGMGCGCAVPPEICDGLDNDCDGDIDEGFNVGQACTNNGVGACRRGGLLACLPNGSGTMCDAPVVTPGIEICNNIDDNCNGQVDEGTLPGVGQPCGNMLGTCMAGVTACRNGQIICNTTSMPGVETCNGLDDNCDGVIDNGVFPQTGQACLCPGLTAAQVGVGLCKGGKLICRGVAGFVCEGCVLPMKEICNGLDDECDGVSDTMAMCPSGFACREGQCTLACRGGEFPCPGGYKCVNDFCLPERCAGVVCPGDMHCDENTGACVAPCAGIVCADPKVCQRGVCVDCNTLGCSAGLLCVDGRCQADKCANVKCGADFYCQDGRCVSLCLPGMCSPTERCVAGQCITDKCSTVGCPMGQFCDQTTGMCRGNACQAIQCPAGERCVPETGKCSRDPCQTISCPAPCWACGVTSDGMGTCQLQADCKLTQSQVGIKGGAGCSCATAPGETTGSMVGFLVLALAGLLGFSRRRRTR